MVFEFYYMATFLSQLVLLLVSHTRTTMVCLAQTLIFHADTTACWKLQDVRKYKMAEFLHVATFKSGPLFQLRTFDVHVRHTLNLCKPPLIINVIDVSQGCPKSVFPTPL